MASGSKLPSSWFKGAWAELRGVTFRVLWNPSRKFWIATMLEWLKNLFRLCGIFLPNLKTLLWKNMNPHYWFYSVQRLWSLVYWTDQTSVWCTFERASKAVFFCKKENSALSGHTWLTNHTTGWDKSKIITTYRHYHWHLCLGAWCINSAHVPINNDDGGLLPDTYLHLVRKKAS